MQPPFVAPPPGAPSPGLAAVLGLIPGVGAMYNGQFLKGLVHVVIFAVLVSAAHVYGIFGLFIAGWVFYQVFEAYHTAKARRDGEPLPDPLGLNELSNTVWRGRAADRWTMPPARGMREMQPGPTVRISGAVSSSDTRPVSDAASGAGQAGEWQTPYQAPQPGMPGYPGVPPVSADSAGSAFVLAAQGADWRCDSDRAGIAVSARPAGFLLRTRFEFSLAAGADRAGRMADRAPLRIRKEELQRMNRYILIRRLRGPAILLLIGVLALLPGGGIRAFLAAVLAAVADHDGSDDAGRAGGAGRRRISAGSGHAVSGNGAARRTVRAARQATPGRRLCLQRRMIWATIRMEDSYEQRTSEHASGRRTAASLRSEDAMARLSRAATRSMARATRCMAGPAARVEGQLCGRVWTARSFGGGPDDPGYVGVIALLVMTGHIDSGAFWTWYGHWWPLLLIGAGLALLGEWALDMRRATPVRRTGSFIGILDPAGDSGRFAQRCTTISRARSTADFGDNGFFNFLGCRSTTAISRRIRRTIPANAIDSRSRIRAATSALPPATSRPWGRGARGGLCKLRQRGEEDLRPGSRARNGKRQCGADQVGEQRQGQGEPDHHGAEDGQGDGEFRHGQRDCGRAGRGNRGDRARRHSSELDYGARGSALHQRTSTTNSPPTISRAT